MVRKNDPDYRIKLETIYNKITDEYCWVHTRGGAIPGNPPKVVATSQHWAMGKSDIFSSVFHFTTDDMGKTWKGPIENPNLGNRPFKGNIEYGISDQTPKYHKKTGKLLCTGHTIFYNGEAHPVVDNRALLCPTYMVYDEETDSWSDWKELKIPEFYKCSAGCAQRYDMEDGTILLPVRYRAAHHKYTIVTVIRCSFDGKDLKYIERGNDLHIEGKRGPAEPSITKFNGEYFLTIRHDDAGYVCKSKDGLNFNSPVTWKWDTGSRIETYNTQTHWITHSDGLFLAYTRNAGNNDHVFRHRAPLFMAQVDPKEICLYRHTEKILIPERGARLGNFGVSNVNEDETWIFNTEVISPPDCIKYGCDGSIFLARILWEKPNKL